MAIVKCPECQQDVSDRALVCPHCGFPLEPNKKSEPETIMVQKSTTPVPKKTIGIVLAVIAVIGIVIISISNANRCEANGCNNTKVSNGQYCAKHTCGKSGCYNYKSADSFYCYTHKSSDTSSNYTQSYESPYTVLEISNVKVTSNSSYTICTGTVKNTGKKTYTFVQVKGSFKDSSGNVVDTDWTYAVGSEGLAPGESTTFRMSVDKNYKISSCSVTLLEYKTK